MIAPNVRTTLIDSRKGITYLILAYRPISRNEAIACIRNYLARVGRKKPRHGQQITIMTVIGHDA